MICKKPNELPYGFPPFSFSKRISKTFLIFKFFKFTLFKDTQIDIFLWVIMQIYFVIKHTTFVAFRFLQTFDFRHISIFSVSSTFFPISHFKYKVRYKITRLVWYYKSKILGIPFRAFIYTTWVPRVGHTCVRCQSYSVAAVICHVPSWLHSKFKVTWLLRFSHKKVQTITLYTVRYYIFASNANKAILMCSKSMFTLLYNLIN